MAVLHTLGQLAVGQPFVATSLIDSRFDGRIEAVERRGGRTWVTPSTEGRAWVTGTSQLMVDPDDPWPQGYRHSDPSPAGRPRSEGRRVGKEGGRQGGNRWARFHRKK